MTAAEAERSRNNSLGALYTVLAMLGFAVMDAMSKWVVADYAIGQMIGRHLALRMEPAVIANWQNFFYLAVALLIGLLVPFAKSASISNPSLAFLLRDWTWPNMEQTLLLSAMGVLSALASLGYIHAYRLAEANFVAPFEYTALLWAIGYGVVFFGDVPDAANLIGAGVVICAGVWMLRKDQQLST